MACLSTFFTFYEHEHMTECNLLGISENWKRGNTMLVGVGMVVSVALVQFDRTDRMKMNDP